MTSLLSPEVILSQEEKQQRRTIFLSFLLLSFIALIVLFLIYESTFWFFKDQAHTIFKILRFPRTVVALSIGALLSLAGHVLQITLENPLAEPYLLGASSGSALLVAIGTVLSLKFTPVLAFIGGLLAFLLVVLFSYPEMNPYTVILNGVVISIVLWSATLGLISIFPDKLSSLFTYFMGSLSGNTAKDALAIGILTLGVLIILWLKSTDLDLLSLGKSLAATMGVNVRTSYWLLLGISIVAVSLSVYYGGIIGFVGLIIPHLFRAVAPLPNKYFIPLLALGGGVFLALADWLSYTLLFPKEIPIGIVCALIGAPVFLLVFRKMQSQ